jgi:membrane protein DedA with SNARE-associated domain
VFDNFTQLVADASGWAYGIVFVLAFLDSIVPVVPSETAVITAGVVAAAGDLQLAPILLAAAAGAFLGDNVAYLIGRTVGDPVVDRFFSGDKARKRIEWAHGQLEERGGVLIVVARFIPGGRTAVTLTAGLVHYPWRRFVVFDAAAAVIWASYAGLLGYFGGKTFEDQPWKGLLVALACGFAFAGLVEGARWVLRRRREAPES